ncbi:hypothetical protein BKA65DRAFT_601610 [Rhexocercosporidium sp. MPI-PUGE-AT-0058]|nr:hypothetical protein BKA65DRAFT_601610 [Rhexocercosporidium sp. MPI-PUGE-AT-0058]
MATPTSNQLPTKEEVDEFRALIQEISNLKVGAFQLADARKAVSDRIAHLHANSRAIANPDIPFNAFTLFPKLPIELRFKVWEEATPGPRVIKIQTFVPNTIYDRPRNAYFACPQARSSLLSDMYIRIYGRKLVFRHHSTAQPSPLRTICSESRKIFHNKFTATLILEHGEPLYFDGANDTIHFYVDSDKIPPFLPGRGLEAVGPVLFAPCIDYAGAFAGIQNLAIERPYFSAARKDVAWLLAQFVNLKVLTITRTWQETRDTKAEVWLQSEEETFSPVISSLGDLKAVIEFSVRDVKDVKTELEKFKKAEKPEWEIPDIKIEFLARTLSHAHHRGPIATQHWHDRRYNARIDDDHSGSSQSKFNFESNAGEDDIRCNESPSPGVGENTGQSSVRDSTSPASSQEEDLKFRLFPKPPVELRALIWNAGLPEPQYVTLFAFLDEQSDKSDQENFHPGRHYSYLCYRRTMPPQQQNVQLPMTWGRMFRIDGNRDTLVLIDHCNTNNEYLEPDFIPLTLTAFACPTDAAHEYGNEDRYDNWVADDNAEDYEQDDVETDETSSEYEISEDDGLDDE